MPPGVVVMSYLPHHKQTYNIRLGYAIANLAPPFVRGKLPCMKN